MRVGLLCGQKKVDLDLPDSVEVLEMREMASLADPVTAVYDALTHPIESPPFNDIALGKKNVCVVISDVTRPVPNKIILPLC